jgi:hypothetical protein
MQYVVRAINVDGVTGTFKAEKNTRREALELARSLRKEGSLVMITGPDGKTVETPSSGAAPPAAVIGRSLSAPSP